MKFSHEDLRVYQRSIEFGAWAQPVLERLPPGVSARSQLERAATSIPLNIAEGNIKSSLRERRKYWEIALGSAAECAAVLDVLVARGLQARPQVASGKEMLVEVASMLHGLLRGLDE